MCKFYLTPASLRLTSPLHRNLRGDRRLKVKIGVRLSEESDQLNISI